MPSHFYSRLTFSPALFHSRCASSMNVFEFVCFFSLFFFGFYAATTDGAAAAAAATAVAVVDVFFPFQFHSFVARNFCCLLLVFHYA